MKIIQLIILFFTMGLAGFVQAQQKVAVVEVAQEDNKEPSLQAEAELGVLLSTGNTEASSYKGKVAIKQDILHWSNKYILDVLYKEEKLDNGSGKATVVTDEKYFASLQGGYKLNEEHSAIFVYGAYSDDRFSGFKYQNSVAVGYSDQIFSNAQSFLNYSIGPGYLFNETDDGVEGDSFMVRLALAYQYQLSEHAKFNQDVSTEFAFEHNFNSQSKSESALTAKLMGDLSLKVSYSVTHNSEVASDKVNTDTITSVSIVYLF